MALPLPGFSTIGEQTVNKLSNLDKIDLLNQQIKAQKMTSEQQNQLFPEQLKKAQMANQLGQLQLSQFVPKTEAETAYKNALTERMKFQRQNPLYGQPGVAGQLGASNLASPEQAEIIRNSLINSQFQKQADANLNQKRAQGYTFNSLPQDDRKYLLAQAAGMGIEPNEAAERFNKGETIDQMASAEGFDPNNKPEPIYPLTTSGQSQLKQRQSSLAELNKMSTIISDWAGPYARKIVGYSPSQVKDALEGKNKDQQAKFLAARMLAPEQAAIRIKSMGGNVGIEAIREMTGLSLLHGKIFEPLVSPEVFKKANDYVEKAILESVTAANKAATKSVANKNEKTEQKIMIYNPSTGRLE